MATDAEILKAARAVQTAAAELAEAERRATVASKARSLAAQDAELARERHSEAWSALNSLLMDSPPPDVKKHIGPDGLTDELRADCATPAIRSEDVLKMWDRVKEMPAPGVVSLESFGKGGPLSEVFLPVPSPPAFKCATCRDEKFVPWGYDGQEKKPCPDCGPML